MNELYAFIATKTTADFVVPVSAHSQGEFNRKVHNAFQGLVGGVTRVGDITLRPTQNAIDNHLLCDGSTITRTMFPQLVDLLNPGEATAELPDYTGSLEATAPTVTQEVQDGGTVSTGGTIGGGATGGSTGGNVPSGGRPARLEDELQN
jgi:hypothetical protein